MVSAINHTDIINAAICLFKERVSVEEPYYLEWQYNYMCKVVGPSSTLDFLENRPSCDRQWLLKIFFLEWFVRTIDYHGDKIEFEYSDPNFESKLIESIEKSIVLVECERHAAHEQRVFWASDMLMGEVKLLPPEHKDYKED